MQIAGASILGIQCSMSRSGNCWDNVVVESFLGTLTTELFPARRDLTQEQARTEIFAYLDGFYNRVRRHSTLGYLSPVEFERRAAHSTRRSPDAQRVGIKEL